MTANATKQSCCALGFGSLSLDIAKYDKRKTWKTNCCCIAVLRLSHRTVDRTLSSSPGSKCQFKQKLKTAQRTRSCRCYGLKNKNMRFLAVVISFLFSRSCSEGKLYGIAFVTDRNLNTLGRLARTKHSSPRTLKTALDRGQLWKETLLCSLLSGLFAGRSPLHHLPRTNQSLGQSIGKWGYEIEGRIFPVLESLFSSINIILS